MADIVKISYLNPLRFHRLSDVLFSADGQFACELIPSFESKAYYTQKFQKGDVLTVQVLLLENNWQSMSYRILDKDLNEVQALPGQLAGSYGDYNVWNIRVEDDVIGSNPVGIYYIELLPVVIIEAESVTRHFLSEPFEIVDEFSDSVLIEYSHDGNEFDMGFFPSAGPESQKFFQLRVEGGVQSDGFTPASKDTFYVDQVRDVIMLNSVPYNVFKFTFGPSTGLPPWMADKLNRIMSLAYLEINGRQYVKNEGAKLEAIRSKGYPFAGWQIDLVKSENPDSITDGEGNQIGDYNNDYNNDYF
jgi:hypothetical protein